MPKLTVSSPLESYFINQRVLVGDEIGTVQRPPKGSTSHPSIVWVLRPSLGYASAFSIDNVRPLPHNQL